MYSAGRGIDEELIAKYGNAWTAEQVEQANNGGYTLQYISLPPETEFVMLISVSSAAGKATLKKEIIATEPYVDPSAEWITVSSEATFVCGFFFNQSIPSLSNVINITNLKVEKLADRDLFRLTDAFSVSRIPEPCGQRHIQRSVRQSVLFLYGCDRPEQCKSRQ